VTQHLANSLAGSNFCVCGKDAAAVQRVVPSYGTAVAEPAATAAAPAAPAPSPNLLRRVARGLARRLRA